MARPFRTQAESQGFGVIGVILVVLVLATILGIFKLTHDTSGSHLKVSNGCKDTDLVAIPSEAAGLSTPVSLQATLTSGGQPVANERVTFRAVGHDSHNRSLMDTLGQGTTDAHGVATVRKPTGIKDVSITFGQGGVINSYQAEFDGNGVTDRVKDKSVPFYCGSKGTANFAAPITVDKVQI